MVGSACMNDHLAKQPFRCSSCMDLREVLGKRAPRADARRKMDEHSLLELYFFIVEAENPEQLAGHDDGDSIGRGRT